MCNENKTATLKKVFEPIESSQSNIYSSLPENSIKDKIYRLRMINGLTQKQFALKTGIGYSSLCKYEAGYPISYTNILKICNTFKLSIDYLKK